MLEDHLHGVARIAGETASKWEAGDWGALAGLWHDLGKYAPAFQGYIRGRNGLDAHIEGVPGRVDHSTAGALHAIERFGDRGRALAYLIAGHHAGLADWHDQGTGTTPLSLRLAKEKHLLLAAAAEGSPAGRPDAAVLERDFPTSRPRPGTDPALWLRMLFSALVDADFLDTEAFFRPESARGRGAYPALDALLPILDRHLAGLAERAADTAVNRARREVLEACRRAAEAAPGLFSLTVPTGGGKTLSSLAFALRHAARHGLARVIYVMPYTSIIEQTADTFRAVFADLGDVILEHHSAIDSKKETAASRLAAENWDAPLVVTTNVQFFESLYAARPSRCRKIHNIARSVVILDEAHLLPSAFLNPVLFAIDQLVSVYGASVLLSTATPPALDPRPDEGFKGLAGRREIIGAPAALHGRLARVRLRMPDSLTEPVAWEALAAELRSRRQVLCVVDRRADCRLLHGLVGKGAVHLSALMCPAHRSRALDRVKARLAGGRPVRVVSTQLVEAGVDIDFPVVYRAFAGLPSIAQAAGRCNREGRLPTPGDVVVFVAPTEPPPGILRQARDVARSVLAAHVGDAPLDLVSFERFYRELYWLQGDRLDKHGILRQLGPDPGLRFNFATAARLFRLISDDQLPVVVTYGPASGIVAEIERRGPDRERLRRLQRYVVSVPRHQHQALLDTGVVREMEPAPGVFFLTRPDLYHPETGLLVEPTRPPAPESLIC